uniref:Eukaryotic translation initiation factor 2 subunit 2 n=1 Tax=Corethrella appendiculata TaxID=1370023 RepID=U5EYW8_9DIPT
MTEDDAIFDPSLMKRKKKKKTAFDLDAALAGTNEVPESSTTIEEIGSKNNDKENVAELDDDLDLENFGTKKKKKKKRVDAEGLSATTENIGGGSGIEGNELEDNLDLENFGKKKKKKSENSSGNTLEKHTKKKPFNMDDLDSALNLAADEDDKDKDDGEGDDDDGLGDDLKIDFSTKKKKKKKKDLNELMEEETKEDDKENVDENDSSWAGSDRDYTYDELLNRVFEIILDKNPDMAAGRKPKFVMRPPQVLRVGTKKTSFANFTEICRTLHRQPKHLLDFLLAELGTSGSVDGNAQLIIKGRFQPKQIENVLRRYIKEYVTCHTCRSPDTLLQKDTRLFFLQCESCGSRCSVASIKSGFQAVTSKRAAIRAKTA